jgi:hypothetical protein
MNIFSIISGHSSERDEDLNLVCLGLLPLLLLVLVSVVVACLLSRRVTILLMLMAYNFQVRFLL